VSRTARRTRRLVVVRTFPTKTTAKQRRELESVIDAGKADGSFRADIDAATLVDAIVGAHIAERARTGRVTTGWESQLFDLFWPTVRA
jgi:hypothetical protein